jgi:hypothetical protein
VDSNLYGAFPVKRLFWVVLTVFCSERESDELAMWRGYFEEAMQLRATSPKVGLMKLRQVPGEQKYGVALREGPSFGLRCGSPAHPRARYSSCTRAPMPAIHTRAII